MNNAVIAVKVIEWLSIWWYVHRYNMFDGKKVWNYDYCFEFLAVSFYHLLYLTGPSSHVLVALSDSMEMHKLCNMFLFLLMCTVGKGIKIFSIFLIVLFVILQEPHITHLFNFWEIVFREFLLFYGNLIAYIAAMFQSLGEQGLNYNLDVKLLDSVPKDAVTCLKGAMQGRNQNQIGFDLFCGLFSCYCLKID